MPIFVRDRHFENASVNGKQVLVDGIARQVEDHDVSFTALLTKAVGDCCESRS